MLVKHLTEHLTEHLTKHLTYSTSRAQVLLSQILSKYSTKKINVEKVKKILQLGLYDQYRYLVVFVENPKCVENLIEFRAISGFIVDYYHILLANP